MAKGPPESAAKESQSRDIPHYMQLQRAHDAYFKEIGDVCTRMNGRYQDLQIEFNRAVENACRTQDMDGLMGAHESFQNEYNAALSEAGNDSGYSDAYRTYKHSIKELLAATDVDDLTFSDMAALSQSLYTVAQTAMGLDCATTSATGAQAAAEPHNPFES